MVLISQCNPKTTSGSYSRLFGNSNYGDLITKIQSASINMGNELEKLIIRFSREKGIVLTDETIELFFSHSLPNGIFVIPKSIKDRRLRFAQKPDIIVVNVIKNTCNVIEIKLGDNFDTKKSEGEKKHLEEYARKLDQTAGYRVSFAVCMFFATDRAAIVKGFKNLISEREAITGSELCVLIGISYDKILCAISKDQLENRLFFIQSVLSFREAP